MKNAIIKGMIKGIRIVMSGFWLTCFTLMFTLKATGGVKQWTFLVLLFCYIGVAAWLDMRGET